MTDTADLLDALAARAVARLAARVRKSAPPEVLRGTLPEAFEAAAVTLATAVIETDRDDLRADALLADLLATGVSPRDLCLSHVAPAARLLGQWWEEDRLTFSEVTLGVARLQTLLRRLPPPPLGTLSGARPGAIFATVPGETHTLGTSMAADHFRRIGWDITLILGATRAELRDKIGTDDRNLVALGCSGRHALPGLHALVADIRQIRPDIRIMVSGALLREGAMDLDLPPLDGTASCMETAEAVLTQLSQAQD